MYITYENILGHVTSAQKTTYKTVQVHTSIEKSVLPSICAYVYISLYFASFYTTKKQQASRISTNISCSLLSSRCYILMLSLTVNTSMQRNLFIAGYRRYLLMTTTQAAPQAPTVIWKPALRKLVQLYIDIASQLVKYFAGKLANYITSDT